VRYVFVDECLPAKNTDRPKFQLMLKKAEEGEFGAIVFWKLDRFARSLEDSERLRKTLGGCGVELASVTEFLDTSTPVGRFNFRNLASVAELEREIIGERARLGMYALAREHRWPNKHPPIGYRTDDKGRLQVDQSGAKVVAFIFQQYLVSKSMPQVAFVLEMNRVKSPRGGKSWTVASVRTVLTNRLYVGEYSVAGSSDHLEELRIVPGEKFALVQEHLGRYKARGSERPQMPPVRKASTLDRVWERYETFLKSTVVA